MRRRSLHLLVCLVLFGYTVISTTASFAIGGIKAHPSRELFPFFTWSLFSWVPETRQLYVVEITRLGDQTFDPPIAMEDVPRFADRATLAYKAIQALGRAGGTDPARRATFEGRYLRGEDVAYRLLRVRFAPLERWQTGRTISSEVIAENATGAAQ